MSWYETCKGEVQNMKPPGKMCDYNRCVKIQIRIDKACHGRIWKPGQPYLLDNPDGTVCYCCCSCFAKDTPIAFDANSFKPIQDFRQGDSVYAAGSDLVWREVSVEFSTNVDGITSESFVVEIQYGSGVESGLLTVTEDHLFLINTPEGRKLIPAGALNVNDKLMSRDGTDVVITQVTTGTYSEGVYQIATGEPTETIDGHLLDSNGVISADFAVQAGYISGQLDNSLIVSDLDKRLRVGSVEYEECYFDEETRAYSGDPTQWPKGYIVHTRSTLFNIPKKAQSFMTFKQAEDIRKNKKAEQRPYSSNYAISLFEDYLAPLFKAFNPNTRLVMDWNQELPNAYSWKYFSYDYVLLTGGLLRQLAMQKEGYSVVISHCLAALYGTDPANPDLKINCVGPADYEGVTTFLGTVYRDRAFIDTFKSGLAQLEQMWGYISKENRKADPEDKCNRPGIDCRIETMKAATYLWELPECADPNRTGFEVISASSQKDKGTVVVIFDRALNARTAGTLSNYKLKPKVEITKAKIDRKNDKVVILDAVVYENVEYTLTVEGVLSKGNTPLDPDGNTTKFKLQE